MWRKTELGLEIWILNSFGFIDGKIFNRILKGSVNFLPQSTFTVIWTTICLGKPITGMWKAVENVLTLPS